MSFSRHRIANWTQFSVFASLMILLTACGGGGAGGGGGSGGNPGGDQGSVDPNTGLITPLTITTPYRGSVSSGGNSYYVVSGLAASTAYILYVHSMTDNVDLGGYVTSLFFASACSSSRSGTSVEACAMSSDTNGNIYIKISGQNASGNANFTIEILSPPANEATQAAPVNIPASTLPYGGSVADSGNSYYVVSGLTPGNVYTVSLSNVIFNAALYGYPSKDFSYNQINPRCYSDNAAWLDESCEISANFEGKIYIKVIDIYGYLQPGAMYTINVTTTGGTETIFEGYQDAPMDVTTTAYNGQEYDFPSYYRFSGLSPSSRYEIHFTNYTTTTDFVAYDDANNTLCQAFSYYASNNDSFCVATTNASGYFYVLVRGQVNEGGTRFTISVSPAPVAEGTAIAPKTITMPYNGQVDNTYSYYVISGLTPDFDYLISASNTTRNILLYAGADFSSLTLNIGRTNASGQLFVKIAGTGTGGDGAWFTLNSQTANNPEGSVSTPVDISSASQSSPYHGQVDDRASYYAVSGLTPGKYYVVHINNVDNTYPDLMAYADSGYTTQTCTISSIYTTQEGHCLTPVSASGDLYIKVYGASKIDGSQYNIWVAPSLIVSEGSAASPVDIDPAGNLNLTTPQAVTYNGQVSNYYGDTSSYYKVTLNSGPANYTVSVTSMTDNVDLVVSDAITGATMTCNSSHLNLMDESCVITSQTVGGGVKSVDLLIEVNTSANLLWDGSTFQLTVTPGGTPAASEGSISTPLDISGALPYTGKVKAYGDSFYKVTGLTPSTRYEVRVNTVRDLMSMYVYTDSTYSATQCDVWFSTPPPPQNIACQATTNASGELYFSTNGNQIDGSEASYDIDIVAAPVAEGTLGSPIDITALLPRASQVSGTLDGSGHFTLDQVNSYYVITGLTPGNNYQIRLTDVTETVYMNAYSDAGYTNKLCFFDSTVCDAAANSSGEFYIRVDGYRNMNDAGGYYTLDVYPLPSGEGSASAPVTMTRQMVHTGSQGQNADPSYYKISGLTPHSSYRTMVKNMSANTEILVFGNANYQYTLCESTTWNTAFGCSAAANDAGELYFKVQGTGNGTFDIVVP